MPDPTNLEQIQEEKAQEAQRAAKLTAVDYALRVLDPTYVSPSAPEYLTLVERLRNVLVGEVATLTARPPSPPPEGDPV